MNNPNIPNQAAINEMMKGFKEAEKSILAALPLIKQAGRNIINNTPEGSMGEEKKQFEKFEAMMNVALQSNPDLILFINPFQLMQIAKEDVKMAWAFFNRGQKKLVAHQQQTAMQNQEATTVPPKVFTNTVATGASVPVCVSKARYIFVPSG